LSDGHPFHFDRQRIQRKLGFDRAVEDATPSIFEVESAAREALGGRHSWGTNLQPGLTIDEKRVANDMATWPPIVARVEELKSEQRARHG
jgi:hypothetical protein